MLELVDVGSRTLESYRGIAPDHILEELSKEAEWLRGARVLHVNATPYGGGVSELLRSVVPLESDLGLVSDWRIIGGNKDFFQVTKAMHNGLQGGDVELTESQKKLTWQVRKRTLKHSLNNTTSCSCTTHNRQRFFHFGQRKRPLDMALPH